MAREDPNDCEERKLGKQSPRPAPLDGAELALFYTQFYGRMTRDIAREIDWQHAHANDLAGNVLCALGLVVYTEVLGRLSIQQLQHRYPKRPSEAFYAFLDRMKGGAYAKWRADWQKRHAHDLYDVLRNGLAHEYFPKVKTKLWFESEKDFGLGEDPGFDLCLRMEPYYVDFCAAGDELFRELSVGVSPVEDLGLENPGG